MRHESGLHRLIHLFSPKVWLTISSISLLLAAGSGWVLLSHLGDGPKDRLYAAYDSVVRFAHETIRLTFKTDELRAAVFVAPLGILNPKADFNWVKSYQDFKPQAPDTPAQAMAPDRLLDPEWKPTFSGAEGQKDFR